MTKFKTLLNRAAKAAILVVCLWLVAVLIIRTLQNSALTQISELTRTRIEAHSVNFDLNGSVLIEQLVIRPDRSPGYDDAILRAEKAYARFSLVSLLLLRPRLKEIKLHDFVFNAQYDLDTHLWNVAELKISTPKAGTQKMPLVRLENGILRYSKVKNSRINIIASVPVDAEFSPAEKIKNAYSFTVKTARRPGGGQSNLTGLWEQGYVSIKGGISSTDLPTFEKAWSIDNLALQFYYDLSSNYAVRLKIQDLRSKQYLAADTAVLKPKFLEKFGSFADLQNLFRLYQPAGVIDIELDASGNLHRLGQTEIAGKAYCKDVSIRYQKLPYEIEHLSGWIDFTNKTATLKNLYGRHGETELFISGFAGGFGSDLNYQIRILSNNLALDNDLYNALNPRQKRFWTAFSPGGLAAIDYQLSRKSKTEKKRTLDVELLKGEAAYNHFPYPLKNLKGSLLFEKDCITITDIVSQWNGRKIRLNGKVTSTASERPMWDVSIRANNIPLDSTLLNAIPEKQRELFSRFDKDGRIRIEDLIGRIWYDEEKEQPCYHLTLQSEQLNINDDLLALLPAKLKKLAKKSDLQGKVNISVFLDNTTRADVPHYKITADCLANHIKPQAFPYPLKDIRGTITFEKDRIELSDITAEFDLGREAAESTGLQAAGQLSFAADEFAAAALQLSINNLRLDENLRTILPQRLKQIYTKLSPTGIVNLNFDNISIYNNTQDQRCIDFDGIAKIKTGNLRTCPVTSQLDATVKIKGLYNSKAGLGNSKAAVFAEALKIRTKRLTNLKADIIYDPNHKKWFADNFTANSYNGRIIGKFELKAPQRQTLQYHLQIGFEDIDLQQFLRDGSKKSLPHQDYTGGKMNGTVSLSATVGQDSSQIGRCRLSISDMKIGRLSPFAKLLTVLKLNEPSDHAFKRMHLDSFLKQNKLLVRKFDLSGPRVAFNGSGLIDLESENVDLTLKARGSRLATDDPSLFGSLAEGLGQAVVRMNVKGNLYDPQITTTTLPLITESLSILGTKPAAARQ